MTKDRGRPLERSRIDHKCQTLEYYAEFIADHSRIHVLLPWTGKPVLGRPFTALGPCNEFKTAPCFYCFVFF